MPDLLRAACVQMNAAAPLDDTIATAERLVARAASLGAELVALPEMWNATGDAARFRAAAEPRDGRTVEAMRGWARSHGVWLLGGSISERLDEGERIGNLSLMIDPDGELVAAYRKIHLFGFDTGEAPSHLDAVAPGNGRSPSKRPLGTSVGLWPSATTCASRSSTRRSRSRARSS